MRHTVLGAGGVGGLLAAVLARSGEAVTIVTRRSAVRRDDRTIHVESRVFGDFAVDVAVDLAPPPDIDVLWVAVKATGLVSALELVDPDMLGGAVVVPLLNGIDHVDVLRRCFRAVHPGTIRVESRRTVAGVIEQVSPFAQITVAVTVDDGSTESARVTAVIDVLRDSGFGATTAQDETTLLWDKLAFLAPLALATTAHDGPLGAVRARPDFRECQREAVSAAHRDGATTELAAVRAQTDAAPASMRSSMQRDVEAGRETELDAIAGAVLRRCPDDTAPATRELVARVEARLARDMGRERP